MRLSYVIAYPCLDVKDKSCVKECPVDCIYEGERMLYINPEECIDCGACEAVCPVQAIFYEDALPKDWTWFKAASEEFFEGGGKDPEETCQDPEAIRSLPKKSGKNQ